jgi:ComF family protein
VLFQRLVEYLAPAECLVCGREGDVLCGVCRDQVLIAKASTCYRCNKLTDDWRVCATCRNHTKLARVVVASHYDGPVQELIKLLKYQQAVAAGGIAASWLAAALDAGQYDLIIPVPSAPGRERQRGYNQAAVIAQSLAQQLALPYLDALGRSSESRQVGQSRQARLTQVQGTIYLKTSVLVPQTRILLVDDVVTTGATLSECAAVLKAMGAKAVSAAVVAKH